MGKKYLAIPADDAFASNLETWLPKDLMPGERVLWIGQPTSELPLVRMCLPQALAGALFSVCALSAYVSMIIENYGLGVAGGVVLRTDPVKIAVQILLSLLTSALVGLLTGAFVIRYWRNTSKVRYLLTDSRVVMLDLTDWGELRERDIFPCTLDAIRWREHCDGSGNVVFGMRPTIFKGVRPVGFFAIENVRRVESMVRKILMPEV